MACFSLVIFVLLSCTSGSPVHKSQERRKDFYFSPKKVVDFTVHISEAGEEYNEKIKVDPNKRTELFEVPAHPGVDRSDTLHDFKQNLTMLRFPDDEVCYLFPLGKNQSMPEKLMRDIEKAKRMVITETRRVDTSWIVDGELTDRSALSDELAKFCAQYPIYRVKEAQESLEVTEIQTGERTRRSLRQIASGVNNTELCSRGMGLDAAYQICPEPELKSKTYRSCVKTVQCAPFSGCTFGLGGGWPPRFRRRRWISAPFCWTVHTYSLVACHEYVCNDIEGSGVESGEESGGTLGRL